MTRDKVDRAIIRLLCQGGRESNREIARQLGISEGTVRSRLKRLEETGEFRLIVQRDPAAFSLPCFVYFRLKVDPIQVVSITEYLFKPSYVMSVLVVLSEYNVYGIMIGRNRATIDRRFRVIRKLIGVMEILLYEELSTFAFSQHWEP